MHIEILLYSRSSLLISYFLHKKKKEHNEPSSWYLALLSTCGAVNWVITPEVAHQLRPASSLPASPAFRGSSLPCSAHPGEVPLGSAQEHHLYLSLGNFNHKH